MLEEQSNPVIDIAKLFIHFNKRAVIQDLSLKVEAGSVVGLLGPNASGKTTLLKAILGMVHPDQGRIQLWGRDIRSHGSDVRTRIGFIGETDQLYNQLSVSQLIDFCRSTSRDWDAQRVTMYLNTFGIAPHLNVKKMAKSLRLQLTLCLVLGHNPDLLIIDDPIVGLDPIARKALLSVVSSEFISQGKTVLWASHNLSDIESMADQIAILEVGQLRLSGNLDEIKQQHGRYTWMLSEPLDRAMINQIAVVEGMIKVDYRDTMMRLLYRGDAQILQQMLDKLMPQSRFVQRVPVSLDDLFFAYLKGQQHDH